MAYQVPMMFHPTLLVDDLEQAATWFYRVFGRRGVRWEEKYDFSKLSDGYPTGYSVFVHMGDVVVDVLAPGLLELPGGRQTPYPEGQGLADIAWYTEDACELARHLGTHQVRVRDQEGELVEGGDVPVSNLADDCYILWTLPDDTGLTYEFLEMGTQHREFYSRLGDPRLDPNWTLPQPSPDDPLGVVRNLCHTILTPDIARAKWLYTEVFGGSMIGNGTNPDLDADSIFIQFAGSVLEFARPRSGMVTDLFTGAPTDRDSYVGMTFQVMDTNRVAKQLESHDVGFESSGAALTTSPSETMGVRWTFTDSELRLI